MVSTVIYSGMLKNIILFFIIFSVIPVRAQFILTPSAERKKLVFEDFFVREISDNRAKKGVLGYVFRNREQKEMVSLRNGPERSLHHYLSAYYKQDTTGVPLRIRIDEFSITENTTPAHSIKGSIQLGITVFSVKDDIQSKVCDAQSRSTYTRPLDGPFEKELANEIGKVIDHALLFVVKNIEMNKGILEAFAIGSRVEILPFFNEANPDTLYYHQGKISWEDFKGAPRSGSPYGAAIFTSFQAETNITVKDRIIIATVRPRVFMDRSMSWVKSPSRNWEGLKHEQLHFDITYLTMLEYLDKIRDLSAETADDLSSMIQFEYLEYFRKMNRLQEKYDAETHHSTNRASQAAWESQLKKLLKERQ